VLTAGAASGNAKRFAYDEENRLIAVYASDGASPPLHEYLYDALGRRILTHDHTPATAVQTRHVYGAGFEPLAEYESSDDWETADLAREFLWGERFPEPLVLIDWTAAGDVAAESEEVLHYLHDHLGSVIALVDAGDPDEKPEPIPPKVVERYTYDPYGTTYIETWNGSGFDEVEASAYGNPFAWTAQRYDAGVGLYAFPFRSYSPALGRFLQRDPLGYIDGPNLYEYARSMPTVLTDPMGLAAGVAGGISGGGGGGIGSGPGALGGAEPSAGGPSACGGSGPDLETYILDPERLDRWFRDLCRDTLQWIGTEEFSDWPWWLRLAYWATLYAIDTDMANWLDAWDAFWELHYAWQQKQASLPAPPTTQPQPEPEVPSAQDEPSDEDQNADAKNQYSDDDLEKLLKKLKADPAVLDTVRFAVELSRLDVSEQKIAMFYIDRWGIPASHWQNIEIAFTMSLKPYGLGADVKVVATLGELMDGGSKAIDKIGEVVKDVAGTYLESIHAPLGVILSPDYVDQFNAISLHPHP
jgi:RHS repeat-associated protein